MLIMGWQSCVFAQTPPPPIKPAVPFDINDWTPRPALGKSEPWERMTDKDWADKRFQSMNIGPFLNSTARLPNASRSAVDQPIVYQSLAIKLRDGGGALFDKNRLHLAAAWSGGFVNLSERRFGLLNTTTLRGTTLHLQPGTSAGWSNANAQWDHPTGATAPLSPEWGSYRGLRVHQDRVVVLYTIQGVEVAETHRLQTTDNQVNFIRTLQIGPSERPLQLRGPRDTVQIVPPHAKSIVKTITTLDRPDATPDDIAKLLTPGPKRWGEPLKTKLKRGNDDGPFAIDELTVPYQNPFQALFFCTGLDFLPDGRIAVCTCHGDVWLVSVDETRGDCSWQRFATGLYQPLGLKVVDGKVHIIERGQLTRLHDDNNDGEADFYECVSNNWHTGGGEHSYTTCLETDPAGNFYFFKTGDTETPTGGCLLKVSPSDGKATIFCTGVRHPIGLGISPTGIITGADQEGNWMPSTRIDQYREGGFYGDMRAHHRTTAPKTYDAPICWLPREVDNSAGGQVWVPAKPAAGWDALAGLPIHFSYGRCRAYLLLRDTTDPATPQGGVADLGWQFLSGVCRGRFSPKDGQLYVCGLNGWQSAAKADGCLQRVRATGKPLAMPVALKVRPDGIDVTFSSDLDAKTSDQPSNYRSAFWNYRWEAQYGSMRWKPSAPNVVGQDEPSIGQATLCDDRHTVNIKVAGGIPQPVMQGQLGYNVKTADGKPLVGSVFFTINGKSN